MSIAIHLSFDFEKLQLIFLTRFQGLAVYYILFLWNVALRLLTIGCLQIGSDCPPLISPSLTSRLKDFYLYFFYKRLDTITELGTATIKRPQRKKIQNQLAYELGGGENCHLEWHSNETLHKCVPVPSERKVVKPVVHPKDLTCNRVFYQLRMEKKKHLIFPLPPAQ